MRARESECRCQVPRQRHHRRNELVTLSFEWFTQTDRHEELTFGLPQRARPLFEGDVLPAWLGDRQIIEYEAFPRAQGEAAAGFRLAAVRLMSIKINIIGRNQRQ